MLQVPIKIHRQIKSDSWRENPQVFHTYFIGSRLSMKKWPDQRTFQMILPQAIFVLHLLRQFPTSYLISSHALINAFKKVIENLSRIVFFVLQIYQFMPLNWSICKYISMHSVDPSKSKLTYVFLNCFAVNVPAKWG